MITQQTNSEMKSTRHENMPLEWPGECLSTNPRSLILLVWPRTMTYEYIKQTQSLQLPPLLKLCCGWSFSWSVTINAKS
jgi:hypothetical protein